MKRFFLLSAVFSLSWACSQSLENYNGDEQRAPNEEPLLDISNPPNNSESRAPPSHNNTIDCDLSVNTERSIILPVNDYYRDHLAKGNFRVGADQRSCYEQFCLYTDISRLYQGRRKYTALETLDGEIVGYVRCREPQLPRAMCSFTLQTTDNSVVLGHMFPDDEFTMMSRLNCLLDKDTEN